MSANDSAVGDEVTPVQWLLDAVDGYPQRRKKLNRRVVMALGILPIIGDLGKPERRKDIESNVRQLAQELTATPKKKRLDRDPAHKAQKSK